MLDLLNAVIESLGAGFAAYRTTYDSGTWFWNLQATQTQQYMESYLISKGLL